MRNHGVICMCAVLAMTASFASIRPTAAADTPLPRQSLDLEAIPFKIVYETYRQTNGRDNWELYLVNADGSHPVNLTNTPDVDEMYPHACPLGRRICFVTDEGSGRDKIRNVYYMNLDGSGRTRVAENARQPCWSPDGRTIAYLKGEFDRYTIKDYATKGLFFYDIETRKHSQHVNKKLYHLYNICWSDDGNWFTATVHGGMGYRHAILAFPRERTDVYDLTEFGVRGCRPDFRPGSDMLTWGLTDWDLCIAEFAIDDGRPVVRNRTRTIRCDKEHEVYHTDFSPDGRYIAFSYGPKANEMVGGMAAGWNICISNLNGKWVQITEDGNHNKEPDWVPLQTGVN